MQKLTQEQADEIRWLSENGYSNKQLMQKYNVHYNTIYLILKNKIHIGNSKMKLTPTLKEQIKEEYYNSNIRQRDLAIKYNVHVNTIHQLLRPKNKKEEIK